MKTNRLLFTFIAITGSITAAIGQSRLAQDSVLEQQLYATGLIHQPLPLDTARSYEADARKKHVVRSVPLSQEANAKGWSHEGEGTMTYSRQQTASGKGSIKLQYATYTERREQVYAQALVELLRTQPAHPDHARWATPTCPIGHRPTMPATRKCGSPRQASGSRCWPSIEDCTDLCRHSAQSCADTLNRAVQTP